jgi:hypothetical protein
MLGSEEVARIIIQRAGLSSLYISCHKVIEASDCMNGCLVIKGAMEGSESISPPALCRQFLVAILMSLHFSATDPLLNDTSVALDASRRISLLSAPKIVCTL